MLCSPIYLTYRFSVQYLIPDLEVIFQVAVLGIRKQNANTPWKVNTSELHY